MRDSFEKSSVTWGSLNVPNYTAKHTRRGPRHSQDKNKRFTLCWLNFALGEKKTMMLTKLVIGLSTIKSQSLSEFFSRNTVRLKTTQWRRLNKPQDYITNDVIYGHWAVRVVQSIAFTIGSWVNSEWWPKANSHKSMTEIWLNSNAIPR